VKIRLEETNHYTVDVFNLDRFIGEFSNEYEEWRRENPDEDAAQFVKDSIYEMGAEDFLWAPGVQSYTTDTDLSVEVAADG